MVVEAFRFLTPQDVPTWFEEIDHDAIRNFLENRIIELEPELDLTIAQPGSRLIDVEAGYHYNARNHQNNLRLATLTRFATGADLEQKGFEWGLRRNTGESDESFRARILAAPYAAHGSATFTGLEALILSNPVFSDQVISIAFTYSAASNITTFYILAKNTGQRVNALRGLPTTALNTAVDNFLSRSSISLAGDSFVAKDPTVTRWYSRIRITNLAPGETFTNLRDLATLRVSEYIDMTYRLGNSITEQDIYNALDHSTLRGRAVFSIVSLNTVSLTNTGRANIESPNTTTALLGIIGAASGNTIEIIQ